MLCEDCKERDATIHYKEIINDQYQEIHLCEECAQNQGLEVTQFSSPPSLANFLTGLVGISKKLVHEEETKECPKCHLSFANFKERGMLGCSDCYESFEEELTHMLRRIHGNIQHVGKIPTKIKTELELKDKIFELKRELEMAIKNEEFERAAQLRDQIREMERRKSEEK
ncbi:TPA: hypothetical protein DCX15_02635 [bacterium]|nr:hypothetical protein [bacterium]